MSEQVDPIEYHKNTVVNNDRYPFEEDKILLRAEYTTWDDLMYNTDGVPGDVVDHREEMWNSTNGRCDNTAAFLDNELGDLDENIALEITGPESHHGYIAGYADLDEAERVDQGDQVVKKAPPVYAFLFEPEADQYDIKIES